MKTIKIDNKEIEVKKIPIGEYGALIKAIKRLPKHLTNIENLKADKVVELLPTIVGDGLPDFLEVIALAIHQPIEEVNQYGLDDMAKVIEAIFEENNFAEVYSIVKKAMAHPMFQKEPAQIGAPTPTS